MHTSYKSPFGLEVAPLDKISMVPSRSFRKCKVKKATVQQGVVDDDPDVVAIFRLTRKDEGVNLRVTFDKNAPPVMLPHGLMAPYNTQNTLQMYDAFLGLLIPQTVAFRVCDIWRGYWAQRLLWVDGSFLKFFLQPLFNTEICIAIYNP